MEYFSKYFLLCFAFLITLTAYSDYTGEVFYVSPGNENDYNELWTTSIENAKRTRLLYNHNKGETIFHYALQKDGPYIVISAGPLTSDLYLIDRSRLAVKARDLTKKRFNATGRVDISRNGDILFTNSQINPFPDVPEGVYLIPRDEIKKGTPQAKLLKEGSPDFLRWSPDGEQFSYRTFKGGLLIHNIFTREDTLITKDKMYPAFSPDGKTLAFFHQPKLEPGVELKVISLDTLHPDLFPNNPDSHVFFGLKWPEKNYLVYGIYYKQTWKREHFIIHLEKGSPEQILEDMENMFEKGLRGFSLGSTKLAVEPKNRLTTVWGELKTENTK